MCFLRYAVGQFMDHAGFVVSHLNISGVRVEDGGLYECKAMNPRGESAHSARLNVYGNIIESVVKNVTHKKGVIVPVFQNEIIRQLILKICCFMTIFSL